MVKKIKDLEQGPSIEEARSRLQGAEKEHLAPMRNLLQRLKDQPPQVLLLEGGLEDERSAMAHWWAALQHCEAMGAKPCTECASCIQIGAQIHSDVLLYDGRISNTQDEENPGPVRALNKENTNALKARIGDTSRSGKKRIVIIGGIELGRSSAANALLKVLEEPSPTSIFVLLSPQREQLLPTLVSRSWVMTLPWPNSRVVAANILPWEEALASFIAKGRGLWAMTSAKGAMDHALVMQIIVLCQKRLLPVLAEEGKDGQAANGGPLSAHFFACNLTAQGEILNLIDDAQEALLYAVNPVRVFEAFAAKLYVICKKR